MKQMMVFVVLSLCVLMAAPAGAKATYVELGRSTSGTVYYYGHSLKGPYTLQADAQWKNLYILDGSGQRYPVVVHKPQPARAQEPMSAEVAQLMPDALSEDVNSQRDQLDSLAYAAALQACKDGASDDQAIIVATEVYRSRSDLVDSVVIQRDRSLVRYWKGWRVPAIVKYYLNPDPEPTAESRLRQNADDFLLHLRSGFAIAIGWEGQYHVVPKQCMGEFREEVEALKRGATIRGMQAEVADVFRKRMSLTELRKLSQED